MSQSRNCYVADINTATSGDNTLVAAVAASSDGIPAMPIKVWKILVDASGGANNLIFKSGSTALNATALGLAANQFFQVETDGNDPYFAAKPGEALVVNLSAATRITGQLYYTLG